SCSFQRFLNIYWKTDTLVQPASDLGVMRAIRSARRTLQNDAIPRAIPGFFHYRLVGPIVLGFKKILVAESGAKRAVAPLVKRQNNWSRISGVSNFDHILAIWPHFEKNFGAGVRICIFGRGNFEEYAQNAG